MYTYNLRATHRQAASTSHGDQSGMHAGFQQFLRHFKGWYLALLGGVRHCLADRCSACVTFQQFRVGVTVLEIQEYRHAQTNGFIHCPQDVIAIVPVDV